MASYKRDIFAISVPSRWDFTPNSVWEEARPVWQDFYQHWSAVDKDEVLKQETITVRPKGIELLVRDSYEPLLQRIFDVAKHPTRGVLITGQQGIGKTLFLWYALIRLITLGQVVIFAQTEQRYLFYKSKVYSARNQDVPHLPEFRGDEVKSNAFIWTLIDTDYHNGPPTASLVNLPCFPIQASPLNPVRYREWMKQRYGARMSLPLWSKEELQQGIRLQRGYNQFCAALDSYLPPSPHKLPPDDSSHIHAHSVLCKRWDTRKKNKDVDIMDEGGDDESSESDKAAGSSRSQDQDIDHAFRLLLNDATEKFGFIARDVYNAILISPDPLRQDHDNAIEWATCKSLSAMVEHFGRTQCLRDQDEVIIAISPTSSDNYTEFSLDFKSPWIAERVMRRIAIAEKKDLIAMYHLFKSHDASSPLAEWCLKPIAWRLLISHHAHDFLFVRMALAGDMFKATLNDSYFDELPFSIHPRKVSEYHDDDEALEPGPLYTPKNDTENSPPFDALWINCAESDEAVVYTVWVFQVQGTFHHNPARGYTRIREVVNGLKRFEEIAQVTVSYVYVCAPETQTAEWAMPKGWGENGDLQGEVFCWQIPIPESPRSM